MPVSIAQVFDLLMALIIVMFVPIGLWRGALREWIALAGIGLGAALAAEWSSPWGGDLAAQLALDPRVARFAVSSLLFLGATLFVGYGAGMVLPYRPDLTWPNRFLGAALGLGNGLLILSNALRIMQRTLFDDDAGSPLLTSALARFLIDYVGWALLTLVVVLVGSVLVGALRRWSGRSALLEEYAPYYYGDWVDEGERRDQGHAYDEDLLAPDLVGATWRQSSAAAGDDTGARFAAHEQQTVELRQVPPPAAPRESGDRPADEAPPAPPAAPAPAGPPAPTVEAPARRVVEIARPVPRAGAPNGGGATPSDEREGQPAGAPGNVVQLPAAAQPANIDDMPTSPANRRARPPGGNGATPPAARPEAVCANCGTAATAGSRFCPNCGHLIGDAERRSIRATSDERRTTNDRR